MKRFSAREVTTRRPLLKITYISFLMLACAALSSDHPARRLWTENKRDAMVRIDVTRQDGEWGLGTGFIVKGKKQFYVLTANHVLKGRITTANVSSSCEPLDIKVDLSRREKDGEHLLHENCAWQLGADLALIPLHDRKENYPILELRSREFSQWDEVFLAGYPNGFSLDPTRSGIVTSVYGENNLVVTNTITTEGMSGGPYLSISGYVVGIHNGGIRFNPGFAQFTSIKRAKALLEPHLGLLQEEQAVAPNLEKVANNSAAKAGLGTMLALRAVKDPKKRTQLWESFSGKPLEPNESKFLESLSTSLTKGVPKEIISDLDKEDQRDRLEIGKSLTSINMATQAGCLNKSMKIVDGILNCDGNINYLPTENAGGKIDPKLIVLHSTMTGSLSKTIDIFFRKDIKASAHFVIDRDGSIVQLVPTDRAAWHAGDSQWKGLKQINKHSISIELINLGRLTLNDSGSFVSYAGETIAADDVQTIEIEGKKTYWHRFTGPQLVNARVLSNAIFEKYKIQDIVGHCTIQPERRIDPGPAFPLADLGTAVLGHGVGDCSIHSPRPR